MASYRSSQNEAIQLPTSDRGNGEVQPSMSQSEENCGKHPDFPNIFQCKVCQVLVCRKCVPQDHNEHHLIDIDVAMENTKQEIELFSEELKTRVLPHYDSQKRKLTSFIQECESRHYSLHSDVKKRRTEIKEEVDRICDLLLSDADKEMDTHKSELKKVVKKTKEVKTLVEGATKVLSSSQSEMVEYNKTKPETRAFLLPGLTRPKRPHFIKGMMKHRQVQKLIGRVKHIEVLQVQVMIFSTVSCHVDAHTIAPLQNGVAWIHKLFSRDIIQINTKGEHLQKIVTDFQIYDFTAVTTDHIIAVAFKSCNISHLTMTGQVTNTLSLWPKLPGGICLSKDGQSFAVTVYNPCDKSSKLLLYSLQGKRLKTLYYTDQKTPDFDSQRVKQNTNGDYCIAHRSLTTLFVVHAGGRLRFQYKGQALDDESASFCPYDVCCDKDSNILVSDVKNDVIHVLGKIGNFIMYLPIQNHGISDILGLSIDVEGKLWVGQCGELTILQYLK